MHAIAYPGVGLVCVEFRHVLPRKHLVLFGSLDMKLFQWLLKRGDVGKTSKASKERVQRGNDQTERDQTPSRTSVFETKAEVVPTPCFQVRYSITLQCAH